MNSNTPRYAIYFAPNENSELSRFGRLWLARSAEKMDEEPIHVPGNLDYEKYIGIIKCPRHYGFHGTLKAPFELHSDFDFHDLDEALQEFGAVFPAFNIKRLRLKSIASFIALTPEEESEQLKLLHRNLTEGLGYLRAPLSDYDRGRYVACGLSKEQEGNLHRHGYPFVMESFKFHLTLTGNLDHEEKMTYLELLNKMTTEVREEKISFNRICLFKQEKRKSPFFMIKAYDLQGT